VSLISSSPIASVSTGKGSTSFNCIDNICLSVLYLPSSKSPLAYRGCPRKPVISTLLRACIFPRSTIHSMLEGENESSSMTKKEEVSYDISLRVYHVLMDMNTNTSYEHIIEHIICAYHMSISYEHII